jgi:hypothetical protein
VPRAGAASPVPSSWAVGECAARRPIFRPESCWRLSQRSGFGIASPGSAGRTELGGRATSARGSQRASTLPHVRRLAGGSFGARKGRRAQCARRSRGRRTAQAGRSPEASGRPVVVRDGPVCRPDQSSLGPGRGEPTWICPLLQPISLLSRPAAPRSGVTAYPHADVPPLQGSLKEGIQDGRPIIRARGRVAPLLP